MLRNREGISIAKRRKVYSLMDGDQKFCECPMITDFCGIKWVDSCPSSISKSILITHQNSKASSTQSTLHRNFHKSIIMQFFKLLGLVAGLAPLFASASPVDAETLFKRDPVDICDRTAVAGDTCNHGPGGDQPHICGRNDPRAIVSIEIQT